MHSKLVTTPPTGSEISDCTNCNTHSFHAGCTVSIPTIQAAIVSSYLKARFLRKTIVKPLNVLIYENVYS